MSEAWRKHQREPWTPDECEDVIAVTLCNHRLGELELLRKTAVFLDMWQGKLRKEDRERLWVLYAAQCPTPEIRARIRYLEALPDVAEALGIERKEGGRSGRTTDTSEA